MRRCRRARYARTVETTFDKRGSQTPHLDSPQNVHVLVAGNDSRGKMTLGSTRGSPLGFEPARVAVIGFGAGHVSRNREPRGPRRNAREAARRSSARHTAPARATSARPDARDRTTRVSTRDAFDDVFVSASVCWTRVSAASFESSSLAPPAADAAGGGDAGAREPARRRALPHALCQP